VPPVAYDGASRNQTLTTLMDHAHLEALRARYGDAKGGEMFDPVFKEVADSQFRNGEQRRLPYGGPATFLDLPLQDDALHRQALELDVAVIGVPMDLGVTNRAGARLGPRAVRAVERIGPYEHVLRMAPQQIIRAADVGDVPLRSRFDLSACHADIETCINGLRDQGVLPLAVGGDHSITYSILRALGRDTPVGLVHFDAHCDTGGIYEGSKFHHGGPFRQAVLDGVLDPHRTIQIGIRGGAEYLWEFSYESGMTVIHAEEVVSMGLEAVAARARDVVGTAPVYVSFDVDCLDPAYAPGTGTPEVGGLSSREALYLMRALNGINMIGGDVVEVAPQYDTTSNTAQVAAQILFTQLCLAATAIRQR